MRPQLMYLKSFSRRVPTLLDLVQIPITVICFVGLNVVFVFQFVFCVVTFFRIYSVTLQSFHS